MTQATVTLTLNKAQRKGLNEWDVTIQGKPRTVTEQRVRYIIENHNLAMTSFKPEEVLEAEVTINFAQ